MIQKEWVNHHFLYGGSRADFQVFFGVRLDYLRFI